MGDPADIGFVDAHPEGHGGADDQAVLGVEAMFDHAAVIDVHSGVVMAGVVTRLAQALGQRFGFGAGAAIDDARLPFAGGGEAEDLLAGLVFDLEGKGKIGAVEAAQEGFGGFVIKQAVTDFRARFRIGGGGEGRDGDVEGAAQRADAEVIGTEIVAPLADAMGLVHGNQRDTGAGQHAFGAGRREAFGRDVEQFQGALFEAVPDRIGFFVGIAGGQRARFNAGLAQATDLVAHQGDQGRDDNSDPIAHQGGQLEAERFAAAGGHDRKDVFAGGHGLHDLGLARPKGVEAEGRLQQGRRIGMRDQHCGGQPVCFGLCARYGINRPILRGGKQGGLCPRRPILGRLPRGIWASKEGFRGRGVRAGRPCL